MKIKTILVLVLCNLVSRETSAQLSIHPMLGGSLNTVHDFDGTSSEITSILGFHGGLGFDIPLGDLVSIEPILRFNQKGFGLSFNEYFGSSQNIKTTMSFKYSSMELPIMFNFNTEVGDNKLVYSIGPYLGYAVAVRQTMTQTDGTNTVTYDTKNNDNFMQNMVDNGMNRLDYGLIMGVRYEINNFTVGLDGAMSIQNFNGELTSNSNKHMNLQFTIGYKIELD